MTQYFPKGANGTLNPYLAQQIHTASPEKLILMMYDFGIKSCRNQDRVSAAKVLVELISVLNFDYHDLATRFFELYRFSLDQVHQNKFEQPLLILSELRHTWESVVSDSKTRN
ncbi:MAG: flagellar export chaperone FliS [bacterium]